MSIPLVTSPFYSFPFPNKHRFPMEKFGLLAGYLEEKGLLRKANTFRPGSDGLARRTLISPNGTFLTAQLALKNGIACHLAGGTHHAHYDFASGFCILNDLAITVTFIKVMVPRPYLPTKIALILALSIAKRTFQLEKHKATLILNWKKMLRMRVTYSQSATTLKRLFKNNSLTS